MLTETVHCFLMMCSLDTCWRSSIPAFVPCIRSLRKLEDFSQTRQAQAVLNTNRLSKSTLSDYHPFADAARIEPIIAQLRDAVNKRHGKQLPKDLEQLGKEIIAA